MALLNYVNEILKEIHNVLAHVRYVAYCVRLMLNTNFFSLLDVCLFKLPQRVNSYTWSERADRTSDNVFRLKCEGHARTHSIYVQRFRLN